METTWQSVFQTVIVLLIVFLGAPFTQWLKIALEKALKKPVEERWALLVTVVVSAGLAVLELWLSGVLTGSMFTAESFPATFFIIFGVATIYYNLLKGTNNVLGARGLLPNPKR